MHYVRTFGYSTALLIAGLIAGCNGELDPNPSAVESEGSPAWQLVLTAETAIVTSVTIQENMPGFCHVDGTVDDNDTTGYTGYTGDGFANTTDAGDNSVDWSVNAPTSGSYQLEWRFANGTSSSRPGNLLVNGTNVTPTPIDFPSTGSWSRWTVLNTAVNLKAGWNTLSLVATSSDGLANIDSLTVSGNSPQAADCNGSSLDPEPVKFETTLTVALLDVSGPTPIPVTLQLDSGDDSLGATDGIQSIDLEPLENENRIYTGTFPPMEVAGQDLILSLSKITPPVDVDWWVPTGDSPEPDFSDFFIDAPNTQLRLPQPFTIDSPAYYPNPPNPPDPDDGIDDDGMEEFALGSDVTLTWSPGNSGEDMRLVYTSRCGNSLSGVNIVDIDGDPGSYTDQVDNYLKDQSTAAKENDDGCVIRLTLERRTEDNNLTPDPALSADSNLVATYRRFIEIKVPTPPES